jgi:hypothetical protein
MIASIADWASTALGATIVGGLVVSATIAIVVSISKRVRRFLGQSLRWIGSIRITTTGRIGQKVQAQIDARRARVVQPRWLVGKRRQGGQQEYLLVNIATGSSQVRSVRLESADGMFVLLSGAYWDAAAPNQQLTFLGQPDHSMMWEPSFTVEWSDEAGDWHSETIALYRGSGNAAY